MIILQIYLHKMNIFPHQQKKKDREIETIPKKEMNEVENHKKSHAQKKNVSKRRTRVS